MNPEFGLSLNQPRSASKLLGAVFTLYGRFFWFFPVLAGAAVLPFEVVVLLVRGANPLVFQIVAGASGAVCGGVAIALLATAVGQIQDGVRPRLGEVVRRSLPNLPAVIAAAITTFIVVGVGLVTLLIPGIFAALRWAVGIPVAAIEGKPSGSALRRSTDLTRGQYLHMLGLGGLVLLILLVPTVIEVTVEQHLTIASFIAVAVIQAILLSFTALAQILLYLDLAARFGPEPVLPSIPPENPAGPAPANPLPSVSTGESTPPGKQPFDPASYSDEDRPSGWYVDPGKPRRMRYWAADGDPGWSKRTAKTPKRTLAEWRDLNRTR